MAAQAIILIDHGTRHPSPDDPLGQLAAMVSAATGALVFPAHLAGEGPSLPAAVDRAVAEGARHIVVCPCFLFAGRHAGQDIPSLVAEARRRHASVTILIAPPLGPDPLLAELLARRARPLLPPEEPS